MNEEIIKKRLATDHPVILVFYVNVEKIIEEVVQEYMTFVADIVRRNENSNSYKFITYIIPVTDRPTTIECINPVLVNEILYDEASKKMKESMDFLKETITKKGKPIAIKKLTKILEDAKKRQDEILKGN